MGKPFDKELAYIPNTIKWSFTEPIGSELKVMISKLSAYPLLVVGSGGSFSSAQFIAQLHEEMTGQMAKAVTPLELHFSKTNPSSHAILILTASGNNRDILHSLEIAVKREFVSIGILCANIGSKIAKKAESYSPYIQVTEYSNPAKKDGFLAVNSLLSTCILAGRAYKAFSISEKTVKELAEHKADFEEPDWNEVLSRKTIIALGGEWAWPVLTDLESKFSEAGLGNILITDLRNFGHGRHHWFDEKGEESALLVLETPVLSKLAEKTLSLIPAQYPRKVLRSYLNGPLAGIDLFNQVFHLIYKASTLVGIDPGKPKVSEFGRKLYHIGFPRSSIDIRFNNRDTWLQRKLRGES
ncbi:SIS domain-containing protein [Desulfobacterales bacterium HSG2]|nr:SIS domain-containing protein [Desulfobacterales bacterium HSG2]